MLISCTCLGEDVNFKVIRKRISLFQMILKYNEVREAYNEGIFYISLW